MIDGRLTTALLALVTLAAAVPPSRLRPARLAAVIYLALAVPALIPAGTRYGWAVQNINAMQVDIGRWIDRELPRTARVAVNDIGAIAFVSRREIIDLMGLVTPAIIPYRRDGDAGVMRYLAEHGVGFEAGVARVPMLNWSPPTVLPVSSRVMVVPPLPRVSVPVLFVSTVAMPVFPLMVRLPPFNASGRTPVPMRLAR